MKKFLFSLILLVATTALHAETLRARDFGLTPDNPDVDAAALMQNILDQAQRLSREGKRVTIRLEKGRYHFHPRNAARRTYYVSNHDQPNPKPVGIAMEGLRNVTLDGRGADLLFYGQMLPLSLVGSTDCTLRNFHIDFPTPHIAQAEIVSNDSRGTTYRMSPEDNWQVYDGNLWTSGEDWQYHADYAIAFDGKTRHLVPQTSDLHIQTRQLSLTADSLIFAPGWNDKRLTPGTRLAIRTWNRPAPGLFLADDVRTTIRDVQIHYAEGMGLLAQMCEDIDIDGLSVCLRGKDDPRYFTTQADATHFSGCRGRIIERNGLYEGMMDDAINVHGTYLKIQLRDDDRTVVAQYMHSQSYGFRWGEVGDTVQFIQSDVMQTTGRTNTIQSITPLDAAINEGVKQFRIVFREPLAPNIDPAQGSFGIENLTWTPEVLFEGNTIRNNRARGSLFSTPRKVVVRRNLFDHTSGCAILLCGDCNGWFETGACHDVLIERNRFVNALTNEFQFTNAVISIYPEIPNLEGQQKAFHSNVRIRNNTFSTFDTPILYAKSVDGLTFQNNSIRTNTDFAPFHWNHHPIWLQHVTNFRLLGTNQGMDVFSE